MRQHLLEIIKVSSCSDDFECVPSKVENHRLRPASMSHQNSTPVQLCATCLCLPKSKAKENGHCQKNLAKALDDYLAKEGCLEHPFSKQILRNYQPCVSTPKTPEQHKECVNQKTLSITTLAQFLSYNLGGTSHEQQ